MPPTASLPSELFLDPLVQPETHQPQLCTANNGALTFSHPFTFKIQKSHLFSNSSSPSSEGTEFKTNMHTYIYIFES